MPGVFVGLDVSKDSVAVAVTPSGAAWAAETTAAGLKALVRKLQKLAPALVVLEATGGYEIPVLAALCDAELPVSLVQPLRVRQYAQSQGLLAKTDALDAQVLAKFATQLEGKLRVYPDETQRALMMLVHRYRQLTEMLVAEKQRLAQQALLRRSPIVEELEETVAYLEAKRKATERQLHEHVSANPRWDAAHHLLRSIPGVGFLTAVTLLAYLAGTRHARSPGDRGARRRRPEMARDSGRYRGQRRIIGGRAIVRRLLHGGALLHAQRAGGLGVWGPLSAAPRPGQALQSRHRRLHAPPAHHRQRDPQNQTTVAAAPRGSHGLKNSPHQHGCCGPLRPLCLPVACRSLVVRLSFACRSLVVRRPYQRQSRYRSKPN